ncbi:MAG: hypothetical protein ACP5I4_13120 [Oceanipulchritudo sp.]
MEGKEKERGVVPPHSGTDKKPWPMSWILIVILVYIALQTAYFLFFSK